MHPDFKRNKTNPLFRAWNSIRSRCTSPHNASYSHYLKNGIRMHQAWIDSFNEFVIHIGPMPKAGMEIDRINNKKGYIPGNVRWSTDSENRRNQTKPEPYTRIPSSEVDQYVEMRLAGATLVQIANRFNKSAIQVSRHLKKREVFIDMRKKEK